MTMDHVVTVRNAVKAYDNKNYVLDNLCMNVPQATIYGLLGASGCGKTTLIKCILGERQLNSGDILVFGKTPKISPQARIGYMPQETALVLELTIRESASFFGWIQGMTSEEIEDKYTVLEKVLHMPPRNRFVKHLSGGEQRRVSLIASLIHNADLLLLDEPTVGLDPELRVNIWSYFVKLCSEERKTLIVSTHYVEEARQAQNIGLMRQGKLLIEGSPESVLTKYNTNSIQDVFVALSEKQQTQQSLQSWNNEGVELGMRQPMLEADNSSCSSNDNNNTLPTSSFSGRLKALLMKNIYRILRDKSGFYFCFFLPVILTVILMTALVKDPINDFDIAIVNEEFSDYNACEWILRNSSASYSEIDSDAQDCYLDKQSCFLLKNFQKNERYRFHFSYFGSMEEAMKEAKKGLFMGIIYFPSNFTDAIMQRHWFHLKMDPDLLEYTHIDIYIDHTDELVATMLSRIIQEEYFKYASTVFEECGFFEKMGQSLLKFEKPVWGNLEWPLGNFVIHGAGIELIFFLGVSTVTLILTIEKSEGVWERTLCLGVSTTEILISHWVTQFTLVFLQSQIMFFMVFVVFAFEDEGTHLTRSIVMGVVGMCGVAFGFAISATFEDFRSAMMCAQGSFIPTFFLSGVVWPIEAMPTWLYWCSYFLPTSIGALILRDVGVKGYTLLNWPVFMYTSLLLAMIIGLLLYTLIILLIKSKIRK